MLYFICNRKYRSCLYDSIGNIVCQRFVWGGITVDAQCRKAYVSVNVDIDEVQYSPARYDGETDTRSA